MLRHRLIAFVMVAITASCSKEASIPIDTAPKALPATAAGVLHTILDQKRMVWMLFDPTRNTSTELGSTDTDIELLAVDDVSGHFYYREGAVIMRDSWRDVAAQPQTIAPMPPSPFAVWLDRDRGTLMAIEMRQPTVAESRRMVAEPPDARPVWAVLWKYAGEAWIEIEKRATSWGADGSVGPAIMDDRRFERGRAVRSMMDAASCAALCDRSVEEALRSRLDELSASARPQEWRLLDSQPAAVAFGVALGDTWHPVGPLVVLGSDGRLRTLDARTGQPMRLQVSNGWLLVSPEFMPGEIAVHDLRSDQLPYRSKAATHPTWVN